MTGIERRRYERVPFLAALTVTDLATGARCEGNSIDLSVASIGFYAGKLFPTQSRLRIEIRLKQGTRLESYELDATVRRVQIEQDGAIMGAEFDARLGPSHLPKLYARLSER